MILAEGASLLSDGVILGALGSVLAARVLEGLLFGVTAFDPAPCLSLSASFRRLFRLCTTNTQGGALEFQGAPRRGVRAPARPFAVDSAFNPKRRRKGDDEKARMAVPPTWLNQLQAHSRVS